MMSETPKGPIQPGLVSEEVSNNILEGLRAQNAEDLAAYGRIAETRRRTSIGLPETATEEEVRAAYGRLEKKNRRTTVGLPETATEEEVKAAYDNLSRLAEERRNRRG